MRLKREYGSCLTFSGGLGTQDLLPRGSPLAVRSAVRKLSVRWEKAADTFWSQESRCRRMFRSRTWLAMIDEARSGVESRSKIGTLA